MAWLAAGVTAVLVVATFWAPGVAVMLAWGWRRSPLAVAAAAPLVTIGVLAPAAVALDGVLRWGRVTAAGVTACVAVAGWGVRRARARRRTADGRDAGAGPPHARLPVRPVLAAVTAGAALQFVPLAAGMRRPDAYLAAHDVSFHLAALAWVRETGRGSSLALYEAAGRLAGPQAFYAAGWHDVAALVPRWPDPAVVATTAALVPAVVAWSVGLAFLTQVALPARPRTWVWAPLLGSAGVAAPVLLVLRPEGMVPNALAVALVPAAVALLALTLRDPAPLTTLTTLVAGAGLLLTHPNAAGTAAVAALPALVGPAARLTHRARRRHLVGEGAALLAVALLAAWRAPQLRNVTGVPPEGALAPHDALLLLASGNATHLGWAGGFGVVALAVVGVVVGRRLRARELWAGWAALCGLYLAATSAVPLLTEVDRLWYGEPRRFAPAIGALAVPAAALALDAVVRRVRQRASTRRLVAPLVVALVVLPAVLTAVGLGQLARYTFTPTTRGPALADDAELDLAARLPALLDAEQAVLGSPFAGAANLRERSGQRVVPASHILVEDDRDARDIAYLDAHLDDLTTDPQVCAALRRLDVGYLYVDPAPWNGAHGVLSIDTAPARGVRLLDSGGTARVYEVTGC